MKQGLRGQRILVTREKRQSALFARTIQNHGANPVVADLLKIECIKEAEFTQVSEDIQLYDWLFFTSANGVHCFFTSYVKDACTLVNKKVAAVGTKTEAALQQYGLDADFVPSVFQAATMASEFTERYGSTPSVLLIQGKRARPVLMDAFLCEGRKVSRLVVYDTTTNMAAKETLHTILQAETLDFITFTSPSTVDAFMELTDRPPNHLHAVIVCIGRTTEKRAHDAGFSHIIVPSVYTIEGMIEKMKAYQAGGNDNGETQF